MSLPLEAASQMGDSSLAPLSYKWRPIGTKEMQNKTRR